jgi:hypothetical protein
MNWQNADEAPPKLLVLPPAAASLDEAHGAIEQWEFYSGKTLDPPQRLAVEIMMAESAAGRWAARTTGREMPRQNGKGDEIEVVEFWGLTQRGEAILHTAHELNTVSSAHQRMVALLSHRDFKGKRLPKVLNGLGQQLIAMGDAVIQYRTRTAGGGRGLDDISRLIVDEAQHARPEQLASATPTLLANPNPQMNFSGTGAIAGVSDWWWSLRIRALGADAGDFGYLGHTAETVYLDADGRVVQEPVDPADRSLWPDPNPALTYGRTEMEFLEEQFRLLGPALFGREHLGVWDPAPVTGTEGVFPADDWAACQDSNVERGRVTYAIEVDQDGYAATIGASDGTLGLVLEWDRGSKWLPAKLAELLKAKPGDVWLNPKGPTAALLPDLTGAGVQWHEISESDLSSACTQLYAAVVEDHSFRHEGQPVLDIALKQATRRPYGNSWVWDRRRPNVSVSPLVAVTIARWAALQTVVAPADFYVI